MSNWLILFFEFFKIGLFSVGGGLATLPFLYNLADKYEWFSHGMIADMVAISESTPGPLGVNMATYTGYQFGGPLGSIVATVGLVFPSVVIIILVSKFLEKFRNNTHVEEAFYVLRPTVTGLIGAAGFSVIISSLFHVHKIGELSLDNFFGLIGIKECILFVVMLLLTNKYKKHPVLYIAIGAAVGIIFAF
ncbi:chromate transporter [Anaerotignum sp. MB30-C6]|uniref:chromate transporter n=1 Tax=Anaerotignum sp. MB30-C6 TaxID=3070814 RepID=UPI0027DD7129|nr:chromate transporter [Anaerotignum sp. MB30-C6]WMI81025.1 chromate transporter [Anaerotignum sp. MB30-C6]